MHDWWACSMPCTSGMLVSCKSLHMLLHACSSQCVTEHAQAHALACVYGTMPIKFSKVIELSKKNRALNLMLEREKQKVAQLQQSLSEATQGREGNAAQKIQAAARSAVEQAAEAADSAAKEAAVWRERVQQQTNKVSQMEQKV